MAVTPTSLRTNIAVGTTGQVAEVNTLHGAVNELTASAAVTTITATTVSAANSSAANTSALNALHTSAQALGLAIVLPPGQIAVGTITVRAPMRGASRTKTTLVASDTVTITGDNITLSEMTIKSANQTALIAANQTGTTLRDLYVDFDAAVTTNWLAFNPYNVDRLRVIDCRFRIGGLQLSLCDDFVIDGNYFDCEYLNTNEPCHISGQSSGQFVNNTVYRTLTDAVDLYSAGHYCVVANNRFYGLRGAAGIECKVTMSDDVNNTSSPGNVFEATVIANNVLRDFNPPTGSATRVGIYAEYVDNRAAPVFAVSETNRAIIITGNVLEDFNVTDTGVGNVVSYWGIGFTGHNGLIANNVIRRMRGWQSATPIGIRLSQPSGSKCVGVRVSGNVIAGVEGTSGIVAGNLDRCQIDDNIIRQDEVNSLTPKFGVGIATGATWNDCSVSGNTFECNVANSFGLRSEATSAVLNRCRVQGNTFKDCGVSLYVVQDSAFDGNIMENATNSNGFNVGLASTSSRGNTYSGNHILMSSDYGLVLTDHDGFSITANSFRTTTRGVLLVGGTRKGLVTGNLSINQSGGTEMPHYSGVSAPDQATITATANLVTT
jgi:hypothetical protein